MAVDDCWPVADSEEEDAYDTLAGTRAAATFTSDQPRTPPRGRESPSGLADKSLFTPSGADSTIGNFTSMPSTSPKPRPRPRVVMKKAAPVDSNVDTTSTLSIIGDHSAPTRPRPRVVMKKGPDPNIDVTSTFSHISDPSVSSTKRTNDSIHPATASSVGFTDSIEDLYSLDIAERAKMRSRKSQAQKLSIRSEHRTNEVIELTSDEDELTLKPKKRQKKQADVIPPNSDARTKSRPKPRLKVKPTAVSPNDLPVSRTADEDLPAPLAQSGSGSSSQPPASMLPSIPPSTPPQDCESSLFSPPVATRKRKRIRLSMDEHEDEDEMNIIGSNPPQDSPSFTIPPPFFAASSSSLPTDSGIEIPPVEVETPSTRGRGKKNAVPPGKRGTQRKAPIKGKKGKQRKVANTVDEAVEDSARLSQEPAASAMHQTESPGFTNDHESPVTKDSTANRSPATKNVKAKQTASRKGKARAIDSSEEEDELVLPSKSNTACNPLVDEGAGQRSKENLKPNDLSPSKRDSPSKHTSTPSAQLRHSAILKITPMSELIRRVNSQPNSPFLNASRTYSPLLKSSRTMLSRIAPLHTNRRTPPPPLPRPPPKKSKKQIELEERIEEELAETVEGWSCLTDDERKALRKARINAELGYEE